MSEVRGTPYTFAELIQQWAEREGASQLMKMAKTMQASIAALDEIRLIARIVLPSEEVKECKATSTPTTQEAGQATEGDCAK